MLRTFSTLHSQFSIKLKRTTKIAILVFSGVLVLPWACRKFDENYTNPDEEWLTGGAQTVFDQGSGAFGHAFNNLSPYYERIHEIGDLQFNATFVSAPAPVNPGLGPVYNNVSCISCHINDGRGKVPGRDAVNTLFRISLPGANAHGGPLGVPDFGDQIGNRAIFGHLPEADVQVAYTEKPGQFADGTPYSLRQPTYTIVQPHKPLPANVMLSPRAAPPVFGAGLLEAIPERDILARADPDDRDGDGISGRPNYVWNVPENKTTLGRFGWKANQPSLLQQTAAAFNADMGITNSLFPHDNNGVQPPADGSTIEVDLTDSLLHAVEFYVRTLAVPGRRNAADARVLRGKALFAQVGCAKCHVPDQRTAVNVAFPPISNLLIHPYTDLLLHDMGPELADGRPDFLANGREWRTPPLWGIGLTQKVNGHTYFLHDGRARNLTEAILWHGGEAESAQNEFAKLKKEDREAVVAFLESL